MCLPPGTNDGIDGAGREAFDAPNTTIFVNDGNQRRSLDAIGGIERKRLPLKQMSKCSDGRAPARRALIDLRMTAGDRSRIGATAIVAAARALCLRKEGVDVVGVCHHVTSGTAPVASGTAPIASGTAPVGRGPVSVGTALSQALRSTGLWRHITN
jgi:hypothetical protein